MKQKIGVTLSSDKAQDATGVYESDNGYDAFVSGNPYLLSDGKSLSDALFVKIVGSDTFTDSMGNAQKAIPLKGIDPNPNPPIPGPLDFMSNAAGLTTITNSFDLATSHMVLELGFRYSGNPVISATHGGEPLSIVRSDYNGAHGVASVILYGEGLTVQLADLVITATGGTIGPLVGRVNDDFPYASMLADWSGGSTGAAGSSTVPVTAASTNLIKGVFAFNGTSAEPNPSAGLEVVHWDYAFSGTGSVNPTWQFFAGQGWSEQGGEQVHEGGGGSIEAVEVAGLNAPIFFTCNLSVGTGSYVLFYCKYVGDDRWRSTSVSRAYSGEFEGSFDDEKEVEHFVVTANGDVSFSDMVVYDNARAITVVFARQNSDIAQGSQLSFTNPANAAYATTYADFNEA